MIGSRTALPTLRAPRGRTRQALTFTLVALPAYGLVLLGHGFLPGLLSDAASAYLAQGSIRCLNDLGLAALTSWCHDYGEPLGYPLLTGGPALALGAVLMYLPGVGANGAYLLTGAAFNALALAGGYGLMRRLGAGQLVAFGTAAAYLLSPTVIGLRGFGGTFFGFLLLPTYAYIDLWVMGVLDRRRGPALALAVIGYAAVKTGAVFMDGYSFIAANLVSTGLWVAWLLEARKPLRRRLAGVVLLVGANALALATYLLYVPGSYEENPIGVFRSMGLDVVTLLVPTDVVWLAASLGVAREHSDLWGDGSNSAFNYVGLVWVGLVIAYLARPPRRRPAIALGAAGLIAFVLALGPSLKVNEINRKPVSIPTYESYLMPEGTAAADFPWAGLYTTLPGVDSMRASYRWFGVTRLALVVLAGLAVAQLAARSGRGRILAALLAGIAVVEIAPNLPIYMDSYRRNDRSVEQFSHSVEADLRAVTRPGERTFFLNYDDSHNDYLANYLAAAADLRSFNAGGDKNAILARAGWPAEVVALAESPTGDEVVTALGSGQVDVVVVPYFHLRLSSYAWPPAPEVQAQARAAFASLVLDQRLHAVRRHWFTVLRLGAG